MITKKRQQAQERNWRLYRAKGVAAFYRALMSNPELTKEQRDQAVACFFQLEILYKLLKEHHNDLD